MESWYRGTSLTDAFAADLFDGDLLGLLVLIDVELSLPDPVELDAPPPSVAVEAADEGFPRP